MFILGVLRVPGLLLGELMVLGVLELESLSCKALPCGRLMYYNYKACVFSLFVFLLVY